MSAGRIVAPPYTERQGCVVATTVVGDDVTAVLTVGDIGDLSEFGGTLEHGPTGDLYAYMSTDDDTEQVVLAAAVPSGKTLAADEPMWVHPRAEDAYIDVLQDDADEEPIKARVPQELRSLIPDGEDAVGQIARLSADGEGWVAIGLVGSQPVYDGTYIDPTTLPTSPLTDGDPPGSSPAVTLTPGILSLIAQWPATINADAVLYDVHLSDTSGFTADSSTLFEEDYAGTLKVITSWVDGLQLDPDTTYYVKVVAKDADGSAAAGVEDSAQPLRIVGSTHITDGSIETPQLAANSVTADQIVANAVTAGKLAAEIVMASTFKTAEEGRRLELSSLGLFGWESAEDAPGLLSIPTDGSASILNMDVIAKSLLALNGAILRGVSRVTKGSALELESATETPMVAPVSSTPWPSVAVDSNLSTSLARGLYWDSTTSTWWYATVTGGAVQIGTDGAHLATHNIRTEAGLTVRGEGGLTKIGADWYVLGYVTPGSWRVYRYNATFGDALASWAYGDESSGLRPAIGTDGTDILIARTSAIDGKIRIRGYVPATGVSNGLVVTSSNVPANKDVHSVAVGTFDFGATRYVVAHDSNVANFHETFVYTTAGVHQPNESWTGPNDLAGFAWNGSNFWQLSIDTAKLLKYTANKWTTESDKWWMAVSLRDGDAVGGEHETPLSPKQVFTMRKRAALQWTAPAVPDSGGTDDPDRMRIWVGRGATEPADSAMWLNDSPAPGVVTGSIEAAVFSGTSFATGKGTDFTDTTPAEIRTVEGVPLIRANGYPRLKLSKGAAATLGGTDLAIAWDSSDVDTDAMWSVGSPNNIDPPYTGQYLLTIHALWAVNTTGIRRLWMEESVNGGVDWTEMQQTIDNQPAPAGFGATNVIAIGLLLGAGSIYRVRRRQESGGSLQLNNAHLYLEFRGPD